MSNLQVKTRTFEEILMANGFLESLSRGDNFSRSVTNDEILSLISDVSDVTISERKGLEYAFDQYRNVCKSRQASLEGKTIKQIREESKPFTHTIEGDESALSLSAQDTGTFSQVRKLSVSPMIFNDKKPNSLTIELTGAACLKLTKLSGIDGCLAHTDASLFHATSDLPGLEDCILTSCISNVKVYNPYTTYAIRKLFDENAEDALWSYEDMFSSDKFLSNLNSGIKPSSTASVYATRAFNRRFDIFCTVVSLVQPGKPYTDVLLEMNEMDDPLTVLALEIGDGFAVREAKQLIKTGK